MRRVAALLALTSLLSGCGVRPSDVIPAGEAPRKAGHSVTIYLLRQGALVPVQRTASQDNTWVAAVEALLAGLTEPERARGLVTAVPAGVTGAVGVHGLGNGQWEVRLPGAAVADWPALALDQLACTTLAATYRGQSIPDTAKVALVGGDQRRPDRTCEVL